MNKRLFSILLALCMVLSLLPFAAGAADVSDLSYTVNGNEVMITKCDASASGALVIPDKIAGKPVTSIQFYALSECAGLTSIEVPESVKTIGHYAFYNCTALKSIKLPSGLTDIPEALFSNCTSLTGVDLPSGVTSIGSYAFLNCTGLTEIKIPSAVTIIRRDAFSGCTGLTSLEIPKSVQEIEPSAFSGCTGLTDMAIPDGVTTINAHTFSNCTGLTSVTIPKSVTNVIEVAFLGCSALKDVYYAGSQQDWAAIEIGGGNDPLKNATVHFNSTGPVKNPFTDVNQGAYYYDAVLWAVGSGVTQGTSAATFSPEQTCTRGQVVTFLWRAAGEPEPTSTANPFRDVAKDAYYFKAVLWAVENGITQGTGKDTFSPNDPCTRGQVVTFLHRANGTPKVTAKNPFTDVAKGAYYYDAVLWAVENGITQGTSATTFSPNQTCTRGQIVTFLYRDRK